MFYVFSKTRTKYVILFSSFLILLLTSTHFALHCCALPFSFNLCSLSKKKKKGHVDLAIECYMKQHGACKQEAYDEFNKELSNAWKDINKEFL